MKVLVTGGAGFIGSQIVDAYLQEGHEIVVLDDLSNGLKRYLPPKVRFYKTSIASPLLVKILAKEKPDVVNHHAAQIDLRKSIADPAWDASINVVASLNLLEASRRAGVKKFIFASSGGAIYGRQEKFPADETHKEQPPTPYGIAKLAVEQYIRFYGRQYDLPFVILRYANVYGPRQGLKGEAGVIAIFIQKLLRGESPVIFGDGKQTRDFVFVEDVVRCNTLALRPNVQGVYNVGTGVETDINLLTKNLFALTGASGKAKHGPANKGEEPRSCLAPGALQRGEITPLIEGLRKTVAWFQTSCRN